MKVCFVYSIMDKMVNIKQYDGEGVGGGVAANDYRCSFLNFLPRLIPEKVVSMQKHTETDETFVLLKGKAMLYLADWHAPVMSEDGKILLIENNNTSDGNSPKCELTEEQKRTITELGKTFCE